MTWQTFKQKQEISESDYAKAVAGTTKMGAGSHTGVTVTGIEPVDPSEQIALDVTWENTEGLTFVQRIFVEGMDWDTKERGGLSAAYIKFGNAITDDVVLNKAFFCNLVPTKPELLKAVVGCSANITIGLPKKGLTVKNLGDDQLTVVDIETGVPEADLGTFKTFDELKDASKEQGFKLVYNRVQTTKPYQEAVEGNQAQIKLALDDATKAKPKAVNSF